MARKLQLQPGSLRPRSLQKTVDSMQLSTNSGLPMFMKRNDPRVLQDALTDAASGA